MKSRFFVSIIVLFLSVNISSQKQIKIGIIGLDTSHAIAFTDLLNGVNSIKEYQDFRIVAAYPYGSQTIKSSYDRIPQYIENVKKQGVEIVPSISELLKKVDCVLLETNDGNLHLEQALEVFKSGKTTFIDKPLGASLAQSIAIFELAKKYNISIFSTSSLRYMSQAQKIRNKEFGKILGADCFSPHKAEPSHPDFGWYGIHGVEILYTVMGTGCVAVNRMSTDSSDVVVGKWKDGRIGTFRANQLGKFVYGGTAFTVKGPISVGTYEGYEGLLKEILKFFKTNIVPVSEKETLEIFTFMEASNVSKAQNGKIIYMEDIYKKGQKDAKKLIKKLKL